MCPAESAPKDDVEEEEPPIDPLGEFAANLARQQAVERGEDDEVDESFIARALAESRRMRGEAAQSNTKRAALSAELASRHGEHGLRTIEAAMVEHAAEVLTPQQFAATSLEAPPESQ